jgi:uncharacterized protein GlcG (DUF336 family)
MLTLFKARKIVNQALQRARELNVSVSVAVCDTSGRLIALNQMDGSMGWEVDRSSMGKAVAAAITGRPSDRLFEQFATDVPRLPAYNNMVPPRGQRGGLPVVEAGIVQGGCGVSGALTREQDEECARAGIAASEAPGTEQAVAAYADRSSPSISMANSASGVHQLKTPALKREIEHQVLLSSS